MNKTKSDQQKRILFTSQSSLTFTQKQFPHAPLIVREPVEEVPEKYEEPGKVPHGRLLLLEETRALHFRPVVLQQQSLLPFRREEGGSGHPLPRVGVPALHWPPSSVLFPGTRAFVPIILEQWNNEIKPRVKLY